MIGYLSLSRCTENLSGGATQRLKLVRHLGSQLNNITHIFLMNQLPDYIRLVTYVDVGYGDQTPYPPQRWDVKDTILGRY